MSTERLTAETPAWSRSPVNLWRSLGAVLVMCGSPFVPIYFWVSCRSYDCTLPGPLLDLVAGHRPVLDVISEWLPRPSLQAFVIYVAWCALQLMLVLVIPGPTGYGNVTPAGNRLSYRLNGLRAWFVTQVLVILAAGSGLILPAVVYDRWGGILIAANVWGFTMTAFVYWKAHNTPTHPGDRHFSGSRVFDLFFGIELNPRLGQIDLKLFSIGRLGMLVWTVVNWSFAAAQYERFGTVTNSMLIVNLLQLLYVVDLFWREDWYLRTIDIQHDRFGFYLAWGSVAWLPFVYTLQALYLVTHPVRLSPPAAVAVLALGLGGYVHFLVVNNQRNRFRQSDGPVEIWGKKADWIDAPYTTLDGKRQLNRLLTSGWWGMARHVNYIGDIMLASAFGFACGFGHLMPYLYPVYLTALLIHRIHRDDVRCRKKYGKAWDEYCRAVPYRLIPGVW